ncbi:hypothetical protein EDB84DRAFT_1644119 [Lactarius hengduanensis]|nr:hypothetical protein EDB84DRAFT_1644119 [Lactarius hengduanensis]
MGIVVLTLRCYLVFQNVFITFKTLKLPPPSSRNNGQPSVRALTQRKRDMKGCMAIWIVWVTGHLRACSSAALALYESLVERIVWIFIPFYDELKSVILIFLILSRARSAEPLYLHVIRPLLKPYVSTLDAILGFIHNLGDFVLLVLSLPFTAAISWWYGPSIDEDQAGLTEVDSESITKATAISGGTRTSSTGDGHDTYPSGASQETRHSSDTLRSRNYAAPDASSQNHQIWYPPPSSYEEPDDGGHHEPPTVMPEPHIPSISVDDWRAYPPFPSSYPLTPVHQAQINMPEPVHPSQFGMIHEEGTGGTTTNDQTDGTRQGFGRSLLPLREPLNPGRDGDLSDETRNLGVPIHEIRYVTSSDEDMDDYETEEDSFEVTLRTPQHRRILRAVPMDREVSNVSINTEATVASSAPSETTGLTTDHHASSLRTTTVTMSRSSSTGSSSAAGVKRTTSPLQNNRSPKKMGHTRAIGRPTAIPRPLRPTPEGAASEDTLDDEDLKDTDAARGGDALLARKRRRVTAAPRTKRMVNTRPGARSGRDQSSESRLGQDSRKSRVARPPVATKTTLRNVDPRMTTGTGSSGSTVSPRRGHQAMRRNPVPIFRP